MSLEVDNVIEQRRLRRRVTRWRVVAAVLAVIAVLGLAASGGGDGNPGWLQGNHIARVAVSGLIVDDRAQVEMLRNLAEAQNVAAVVLDVNSPGGTTTGGEVLYGAIAELAKKKPVVAVCGTMATSAAYMISLAADRIVVRGNTITGSVGVIFQFPEVHEALGKLGIKMNEIKSGPLKATPSMFSPLDEPGRQLAESMVKESQVWFLGLVTERRKITPAGIPGLEAGSIYSGRQAVQYKLADAIGGEAEAIAWLEKEKGIAAKLPVLDWRPKPAEPLAGLLGGASAGGGDGLLGLARRLLETLAGGADGAGLDLDGLVSVWHGEAK